MALRMRKPETLTLGLSDGEWIVVKKHLTAGERRALFSRMMKAGVETDRLDTTRVGMAKLVTYLLDWSAKDADGKPVVIADQPVEVVEAALDALDPESFAEILAAVDAHDDAMEKARATEKNAKAGGPESLATSPSADSLVGATNG